MPWEDINLWCGGEFLYVDALLLNHLIVLLSSCLVLNLRFRALCIIKDGYKSSNYTFLSFNIVGVAQKPSYSVKNTRFRALCIIKDGYKSSNYTFLSFNIVGVAQKPRYSIKNTRFRARGAWQICQDGSEFCCDEMKWSKTAADLRTAIKLHLPQLLLSWFTVSTKVRKHHKPLLWHLWHVFWWDRPLNIILQQVKTIQKSFFYKLLNYEAT